MVPVVSMALAIGRPLFALWRHRGHSLRRPWLFSVGSFACCGSALVAELLTVRKRVFAGDLGGLEDTIGAVIALSIGLLVVTVVLNLVLLGSTYEKERRETDREEALS